MTNPNSPVFRYSEKIGMVLGRIVRYIITGSIIIYIGGKLGGSNSNPNPVGNPPVNNPPASN